MLKLKLWEFFCFFEDLLAIGVGITGSVRHEKNTKEFSHRMPLISKLVL